MNQLDLNKPLFQLTAGEFLLLLKESVSEQPKQEEAQKRLVYGIAGIAQLFGCSKTTANRIKASGKIDEAITQCGRMITVDADLALSLLKK
jgi:hypothetical protein|nr:MAG TPA: Protein of unknown function (DUF3853) [Caudoviricetes sp.]